QSTAGSINPTLNVCAMDIGQQDTWQLVAQAFKASSGAGTQPPSGRATMVRDQVIWSLPQEISLSLLAAPTNGNVIVVASSQFQNDNPYTTLHDNEGTTWNSNTVVDPTADPQQYYSCLGSGGVVRDRVLAWTPGTLPNEYVLYDIAGAKTSGGSSGCAGAMTNDHVGFQAK